MIARLFAFLFLLLPMTAQAAGGIVSAANPLAAGAGREMLRAGGSATDAAMAVMLALTVVEPQSSGIGGAESPRQACKQGAFRQDPRQDRERDSGCIPGSDMAHCDAAGVNGSNRIFFMALCFGR